ncbi:MAG TPA: hypothetical protein VG753_00940 [Candidatus Paceibacterota bacterium]|nr:hypothetical protein [Candidatus Paceibacterota bacterium]
MEDDSQQIEELKQLVRQSIALGQDNSKMLHSMRRSAWFATIMRLFWIALVIGASVYSYLYLQPYINELLGFYGNLQGLQQKAQSYFGSPSTTNQ